MVSKRCVKLAPLGVEILAFEGDDADRPIVLLTGGMCFILGCVAAGEIDVVNAVVARIGAAEIVEHELIIGVRGLPLGEVRQFLAPVDVGIAQ
jgi:hypothetical protein